jgi:hypothetical protein
MGMLVMMQFGFAIDQSCQYRTFRAFKLESCIYAGDGTYAIKIEIREKLNFQYFTRQYTEKA